MATPVALRFTFVILFSSPWLIITREFAYITDDWCISGGRDKICCTWIQEKAAWLSVCPWLWHGVFEYHLCSSWLLLHGSWKILSAAHFTHGRVLTWFEVSLSLVFFAEVGFVHGSFVDDLSVMSRCHAYLPASVYSTSLWSFAWICALYVTQLLCESKFHHCLLLWGCLFTMLLCESWFPD